MAKPPIDRRVTRSREMLHQALLSLITEKGYEAITVEEICERADVGRSTFCAHFTSKDDLKRRGLEHLRRELIERQKSATSRTGANAPGLAFTSTMFEHARDHIHLYRALVGSRGGAIVAHAAEAAPAPYKDARTSWYRRGETDFSASIYRFVKDFPAFRSG
jgi:AcrR family transcriptional regulator